MDPVTVGIVVVAALSGVASTLAGIFTRKAWKKITKTEAAADTLRERLNLIDPAGPNKFEPTTKADPAPTEKPGRKPGQSREHH
jgi:hypothetical protein